MPLLLRAHGDEDDAETKDDAANEGHASVDASPPLEPLVQALRVDVLPLVSRLHSNVEMAANVDSLRHGSLRLGRDRQNGANHPCC